MLTEETQVKLTAYALGELDTLSEAELAEVQQLLENDPEARACVKEIQETAAVLTGELAAEPAVARQAGLTDAQRVAIAAAAAQGPGESDSKAVGKAGQKKPLVYRLMYLAMPISAAAACAIAAFVLVDWRAKPTADEAAIGHSTQLSMLPAEKEVKVSLESYRSYSTAITAPSSAAVQKSQDYDSTDSSAKREQMAQAGAGKASMQGGEVNSAAAYSATGSQKQPPNNFGAASRSGRTGARASGQNPDDFVRLDYDKATGEMSVSQRSAGSTEHFSNSSDVRVNRQQMVMDMNMLEAVENNLDVVGATGGKKAQRSFNLEAYDPITENQFLKSLLNPLSTFSIDVDTASYANVRRFISAGQQPPTGAVRIEELINYFPYSYSQPADDKPFAVHVETHAAPWAKDHLLVKVGLKGKEIPVENLPPANIVFLIDVSGSMNSHNKLPLVVQSLKMLTTQLRKQDKVSIVVYAGRAGQVLPATAGDQKTAIMDALDKLQAGGSTNGAGGITQAYQVARENFVKGGSNRVVLMTDGDFNVGVTNRSDLVSLIEKEAKSGVYLSIFGFGMGNYKDATLEELSRKGNGNYGYIDTLKEAQKALVEQFAGTMFTIAKDVKIQVEFNPAAVSSYRLIGYENRIMAKEDFNNDLKDAGDIGAGHTVTALYEVVPVGVPDPKPSRPTARETIDNQVRTTEEQLKTMRHNLTIKRFTEQGLAEYMAQIQQLEAKLEQLKAAREQLPAQDVAQAADRAEVDPLKYQAQPRPVADATDLLTVKLRYKAPDAADVQGTSRLIEFPIANDKARFARPASQDFNFAASVAAWGMLLRNSGYAGAANLSMVLALAESGLGEDTQGHRAEFITLVKQSGQFLNQDKAQP